MKEHIIKMPDIGEGIAEVEIVEWHVAVGDTVAEDQVLADVMTDKASVEIPSPLAGTVLALGGEAGDVLAVGSPLIVLAPAAAPGVAAEDSINIAAGSPDSGSTSNEVEPLAGAAPETQPEQPESARQADQPRPLEQSRPPEPPSRSGESSGHGQNVATRIRGKVLASPSVRHRARQLDIDLRELAQAHPDEPISHRDLDQFLLASHSAGRPADGASASEPCEDAQIKVIGLRRQIAQKMQTAKQRIPHFSYVEEVDVTDLEYLRAQLNDGADNEQGRLTLLPFLVRALVLAVRSHPQVNAHYNDGEGVVTRFGAVHLGVATQTDAGLMVPVLRNAQDMDLWESSAQIRRLAGAVRHGRAKTHELTGSTLTLSSLGRFGGIAATPIINHPEVAIVGVNRIVERPVIRDGAMVTRKIMNLSSSFDHRVVDGMDAARFIQDVRRLLECPALMFLDARP